MSDSPGGTDPKSRAKAIVDGADASATELKTLAGDLRRARETVCAAEMLTAVARRAIRGEWRPDERDKLACVLRDHQQFNYARRLLSRVRTAQHDSEELRQQHALCTYKDLELPAGRRLDRALKILEEGGPLDAKRSAETLGIAGAVYKRLWECDARRDDLENALYCYELGFERANDDDRWYAGVNAAFVADRLADLERMSHGDSKEVDALRARAREIRAAVTAGLTGGDKAWNDATLGEAYFGLGQFDKAAEHFAAVASEPLDLWRQETTAAQIAALARLHGVDKDPDAVKAIAALVGNNAGALLRGSIGKVGIALSGGGFRASLFHIGVLARLAECNVLRHVEVLSCVSGGSILGTYYYLKLRARLEETPDNDIDDEAYVKLVHEVADEFLAGVRKDVRNHLFTSPVDDARMVSKNYSRTDRAGELYEDMFYARLRPANSEPWTMPDLLVTPAGSGDGFSLRYENWLRSAKVPMLVLNATTLNTGHSWQFTATWMGEPPSGADARTDASRRLRRVYYWDAPEREDLQRPALGKAVAASACVPGLFPPIRFTNLYDDIDVELVDGGVHDNQGIASLVEQDCTVILVSDASGQLSDDDDPERWIVGVLKRSNSILMKRVRGAQYGELLSRSRSGALRGLMAVHLTKGLRASPRDWSGCKEPWTPEDDAVPADAESPYGINEKVQRHLAALRTDLDVFSDDEAYALMAAGYLMTERDLGDALPEHATQARGKWPFSAVMDEVTAQNPARLIRALEGGEKRFFRKPRAALRWLRRKLPFK